MSRWMLLLLAVSVLCGAACQPCTSVATPLGPADGGAFRCVTATDCPRSGNDLVCVTTAPPDYTSTCVSCVSTQCVRVTVSCQ